MNLPPPVTVSEPILLHGGRSEPEEVMYISSASPNRPMTNFKLGGPGLPEVLVTVAYRAAQYL